MRPISESHDLTRPRFHHMTHHHLERGRARGGKEYLYWARYWKVTKQLFKSQVEKSIFFNFEAQERRDKKNKRKFRKIGTKTSGNQNFSEFELSDSALWNRNSARNF